MSYDLSLLSQNRTEIGPVVFKAPFVPERVIGVTIPCSFSPFYGDSLFSEYAVTILGDVD